MITISAHLLITKKCSNGDRCVHPDGPILPLSEFHNNKRSKNGKANICKRCNSAHMKEYYSTQWGKTIVKKAVSKYSKTEKGKNAMKRYYEKKKNERH